MAAAARPDFPSPTEEPAGLIDRLRRRLRAVEASTGLSGECAGATALGIPLIDGALGGGLVSGALHEIAAARETETAAASGFALALAVRINRSAPAARSVLWVAEDLSLAENGMPYGPGLDETGIAPERLITVAAARRRDVLWTMEEALRCRAVGVVIGELRAHGIDQVATRRLSLAAAAGGTLGLILRTAPDDEPSAAATRWIIGAAPSFALAGSGEVHGIGPQRLSTDRISRQSHEASRSRIYPTSANHSDRTRVNPSSVPLVVFGKRGNLDLLVAVDAPAERLGLRPGLALAQARAMHPALTAVPEDQAADARLLDALADWCQRYTPLIAADPSDGILLDISGCAHLFGGEQKLRDDLLARVTGFGFSARAAIASTIGAAWAAAHFHDAAITPTGG